MSTFDKERCLCDIDVHPATEIIAIIHIASYFLIAIGIRAYLIGNDGSDTTFYWLIIGFCILEILSSGFLLLGKIKSYAVCYLPFIILHVMFYPITVFFVLYGLFIWIIGENSNHNDAHRGHGRLSEQEIGYLFTFSILSIVYTYILSIVIRSRLLKEGANTRPAPENLIDF